MSAPANEVPEPGVMPDMDHGLTDVQASEAGIPKPSQTDDAPFRDDDHDGINDYDQD